MEKEIQKTKNTEEHFIRTYAHFHRYLPDKGYYVSVDTALHGASTHIHTNKEIGHLSDPNPISSSEFMKAYRSAIGRISGKPEADTMEIHTVSPTDFIVYHRQGGTEVRFRATYLTEGHFSIAIDDIVTTTGDSIYGFMNSMGLLDFLKSELVNICREHIHVSKDEIEEDEAKTAKEQLYMIRDSYML